MIELHEPKSVGMCPVRLGRIAQHFDAYVKEAKIPGYLVLVARRGKVVYLHRHGERNKEEKFPVEEDTIFRIYSMTKPIASVALMMLYERGLFQLDDPVSRFIPGFKDLEVFHSGNEDHYETCPTEREMRIRDLLTHTSGLTYGFMESHPVDGLYRRHRVKETNGVETLHSMVKKLESIPLLFSPGTKWSYSVSTDICGHLVEQLSGQPLDEYFSDHLFGPLEMTDTAFYVEGAKVPRFASNYEKRDGRLRVIDEPPDSRFIRKPILLSGGGGLTSTAADYFQFCRMLSNKGELNGHRLLGRKTVELMTANHLPGNADLSAMGQAVFSETPYDGIGFGLGFYVVLDPATANTLASKGEYGWGGAASTAFWIDPKEETVVIFLTQFMPSSTYPIRRELRVLVNQAITE
jgi:CubicO group peptidase (beta-lactamase class C family)